MLTPIQIKVTEQTPLYTSDTKGPEATTDAKTLPGILGTAQYDDDEADPSGKYDDGLSGKCLNIEGKFKGKFKSPKADTAPITNSHTSDTASNSHKSLTADTDYNINNNPINGLSTYKPKTLPLAHNSNQSLILDTDYTKNHHVNSIQFTI